MGQIVINDGEWVDVTNTRGESLGGFYFNPADSEIATRCDEIAEFFGGLDAPAEMNGAYLHELNNTIKEKFDYLLGQGAGDTLFKKCAPVTLMPDGDLYANKILEIVFDYITKETNARIKKFEKNVSKYTNKYHKKG